MISQIIAPKTSFFEIEKSARRKNVERNAFVIPKELVILQAITILRRLYHRRTIM